MERMLKYRSNFISIQRAMINLFNPRSRVLPSNRISLVLPAVLLLAAACLCSCSAFTWMPVPWEQASAPSTPYKTMNVYIARGSLLADPQFEQYALQNSMLYFECGSIRSGKQTAYSQFVTPLGQEDREKIQAAFDEIAQTVAPAGIDKPGDTLSFAGPGQFLLDAHTESSAVHAHTGLDSVIAGAGPYASRLRDLVRTLRAIADRASPQGTNRVPPLCGDSEFFGLGMA